MKFIFFTAQCILNFFLRSFIIKTFWGWFIMKVFENMPAVTFYQSIGLLLFVEAFFTLRTSTKEEDHLNVEERQAKSIYAQFAVTVGLLFTWFLGYLAHTFLNM